MPVNARVSTQLRDGALGVGGKGACGWNYVHKTVCVRQGRFTIYLEDLDLPS